MAMVCIVFAVLALNRRYRQVFIATVALECIAGAYFFLPVLWHQLRIEKSADVR